MATIILKGSDRKLECTLSQCEKINKLKESSADRKLPLNISGVVVELGDIKYAIPDGEKDREKVSEERKEENDKYYQDATDDYKKYIEKRCLMPIHEKSKDVRLFEVLFFGTTGKKLSESQISYIQKIQLEYFTANKLHPYANFDFSKLLKDVPGSRDSFNMKYHIGSSALRTVANLIEESFSTARQLNLM
jgi:hypothetical protein